MGPQEMQEACVSRTQCEESSLHWLPVSLDTRGKRTGSTRGWVSAWLFSAVILQIALDLCASKACRSLTCAGSAKEQKGLSLGCFTEITPAAAPLPLLQAAARSGSAPACEVNLTKVNLTKTAVSGRITDFHCRGCSAAPVGAPAPLPGPARRLQRAPERRAGRARCAGTGDSPAPAGESRAASGEPPRGWYGAPRAGTGTPSLPGETSRAGTGTPSPPRSPQCWYGYPEPSTETPKAGTGTPSPPRSPQG